MEKIIYPIMFNYFFALAAIIFGIWKLKDTIKNTPTWTNSALQPFLSGIAAGVGSIFVGVIIIYFKLNGKL